MVIITSLMINDHTYIKRCNQAMVGAIVKWCLGRRQLAHSSASKLHCDYLQVFDDDIEDDDDGQIT